MVRPMGLLGDIVDYGQSVGGKGGGREDVKADWATNSAIDYINVEQLINVIKGISCE